MKSQGILKHALIAFAIAVAFYVAGFSWIQHRREVKGPWTVVFLTDPSGTPSIIVSHAKLDISQKITFTSEKLPRANYLHAVEFAQPRSTIPFGQVIFQDPTFLPGTLTLNFFDHEIELLPRVLIIDKKEISWGAEKEIRIAGRGKYPVPKTPATPLHN